MGAYQDKVLGEGPSRALLPEEEPEWRVGCAPSVRLRASEELGWAHIRGLAVGPVQQWLRDTLERQQRTPDKRPTRGDRAKAHGLHFGPWGSDHSLNPHNGKDEQRKDRVLLLNVADYPLMLRRYFSAFFEPSVAEGYFGSPFTWEEVPACILEVEGQLRAELPDLLGDYALAYVQITRQCSGNEIEWHPDSAHFGEVIITVGLAGNAEVLLRRASHSKLGGGWQSQQERNRVPDVPNWLILSRIGVGDAYSLVGCSRYRYEHKVISDIGDVNSPEFGTGVSRVAMTLRYFRRSFCQVETRRLLSASTSTEASEGSSSAHHHDAGSSQLPPLTAAELLARSLPVAPSRQFAIVDVKATLNSQRNPFTFPALVLGSADRAPPGESGKAAVPVPSLYVQYLCDRRTPAMPAEAVKEREWVTADVGVETTEATARRCREEHPELAELTQGQ